MSFMHPILFLLDIDECSMNNGGCSQICNNSVGGYNCACYPGYEFDPSLQDCAGRA